MIKRFFHGAIIYSLLPQLPKVITIFTYPLLTRHLTASDYGIYGITTAYVGVLSILKELGFSLIFINTYYKHPKQYQIVWRHLHGFLYFWSFLYSVLLTIILLWAIPHEARVNAYKIIILSVVPVFLFENVQTYSTILYRLNERPLPLGLISLIGGIISIAVTLLLIVRYNAGYMGWFYASFISSFVLFILHSYYAYIKKRLFPVFKFRWHYLKKHLRLSGPLILHDYSGYLLNSSDRVVMDIVKVDVKSIGFYNIAYIFGGYFSFFETAMGMAASPIFLKYYSQNKQVEARRLTYLSQCVFLIVSFLTCLWLKEVFFAFIKIEELKSAYSLAIIIIMGYNYKPMYQASTNVLFYNEKISAILKISFLAGVLNIILNFVLIPIFGFKVAAFTTLGCLLFMGFRGFYLKEYLATKAIEYYPLRWLFAIIATTVLVYLLRNIPVLYKVFVSSFILTLTAIAFQKNKQLLLLD